MKKIAHYRRNASNKNGGFNERVTWQLSKGPMTGLQLSELLKVSLRDFNRNIRGVIKPGQTCRVARSNPVPVDGVTDYTYTLLEKPKRITPPSPKPTITTIKAMAQRGEEQRVAATLAAERRARMIAKGWHPSCWVEE